MSQNVLTTTADHHQTTATTPTTNAPTKTFVLLKHTESLIHLLVCVQVALFQMTASGP